MEARNDREDFTPPDSTGINTSPDKSSSTEKFFEDYIRGLSSSLEPYHHWTSQGGYEEGHQLPGSNKEPDSYLPDVQEQADRLSGQKPDLVPPMWINNNPESCLQGHSASGQTLKNGDVVEGFDNKQTLTRPDGETLTINADGSYGLKFGKTDDLEGLDGQIKRYGDLKKIHLGGAKDGEDILFDSKGILEIYNGQDKVARRR